MNMFKKNGGFTLVELIVVIAILAILAGIAVPAYSGYLQSANKAGDITALSAVKTAAVASQATVGEVVEIQVTRADNTVTTEDTTDKAITEVKLLVGAEKKEVVVYTIKDGAFVFNDANFATYLNNDMIELKSDEFAAGATWTTANGWVKK